MSSSTSSSSQQQQEQRIVLLSVSLFTIASYYMTKWIQKQSYRDSSTSSTTASLALKSDTTITNRNKNVSSTATRTNPVNHPDGFDGGIVSYRGYRIANGLSKDNDKAGDGSDTNAMSLYIMKFFTAMQDPCHAQTNRRGYIPLCVAENKLILDLIADRFNQAGTAEAAFTEFPTYCYNSFLGLPMARDAVAYFLYKRFYKKGTAATSASNESSSSGLPKDLTSTTTTLTTLSEVSTTTTTTTTGASSNSNNNNNTILDEIPIQGKHIIIGCGAAPMLSNLFYLLGEDNGIDCSLIPVPYYAAFESDMSILAKIHPFPIKSITNVRYGPTPDELDVAYQQAIAAGYRPRFLLLSNPNNPLGTVYPPESLMAMINWARSKGTGTSKMHIIIDEIYALSTHQPPNTTPFRSIIQVLDNKLGDDVHMVYALSKDFGASGLRYGIVYTQNEVLVQGFGSLNVMSGVAGPLQYMVSELLTDDTFLDHFLEQARQRIITSCYEICCRKLDEMVIPYLQPDAGIFIYVDFSSLLPEKTFAMERQFADLLFDARIVLTPGESQRETKAGMFRICYAWVPADVLKIAMERLSRLVAKLRRMDWDDVIHNNDIRTRMIQHVLGDE